MFDPSDELNVGTERGMHKVRRVRRREATERVDLTFLNSVSARPWDGSRKVRDVRIVFPDVIPLAAMANRERSTRLGHGWIFPRALSEATVQTAAWDRG